MRQYAPMRPLRLRVRLRLVDTDLGGRKHGIESGYRCQWRSDRKPAWNDAAVDLERGLAPGDEGDAWLRLGVPRFWEDAVVVGDMLEGGEGPRVIARATILEVLSE